jgi:hypothetical protein
MAGEKLHANVAAEWTDTGVKMTTKMIYELKIFTRVVEAQRTLIFLDCPLLHPCRI